MQREENAIWKSARKCGGGKQEGACFSFLGGFFSPVLLLSESVILLVGVFFCPHVTGRLLTCGPISDGMAFYSRD